MGEILGIVGRRVVATVATLFGLIIVLFHLLFLLGSPINLMMGEDGGTQEQADAIRERLGLDQPIWQQFLTYMGNLLTGDLGESWRYERPVLDMITERLPATLTLGLLALLLGVLIALPLGLLAAVKPGSWLDNLSRVGAVTANSLPNFWLAIMLIIVFAVQLGWVPATGRGTWQHLVLPVIVLATGVVPMLMRITRAAMLEVLNKDYVRTARSKGLPERTVLRRHALRNAMIPVTTVIALRVGDLVAGTVIVEAVFAYPGVGRVLAEAMAFRDYPVVLATVTLTAASVLLVTLITDIIYTVLDPRVRIS
ncbi:ABC transporter permease [Jiangella ureilytica]|uniref:ABC transporter permease n=1 Tax=Jiangella ureilytica TaxID=2530374 RepID=A0A4R4RRY3_9ACTN|nr:ABC transporter permease [Jiangella ureilytica]TDC52761.1 ABC transporter permease [Jiangella ureilytica]